MAVEIEYACLSDLFLDPSNPRLGSIFRDRSPTQREVYEQMRDWSLEELATSFLEAGFWAHEAVLCCEEEIEGHRQLLVVEGNRRVATLRRLKEAYEGIDRSRRWLELVRESPPQKGLFSRVPFIRIASRTEVASFLGYRHVTGIKEWAPPEKADFIYRLIKDYEFSYRDVMRRIGSKTPAVERNYVAYCILLQMEETEDLDVTVVKNRFSVLFLSLRSQKVRRFLGVDDKFGVAPREVYPPVPEGNIANLKRFALWLFGDQHTPPVVNDSRDINRFAAVLESDKGVQYLRSVTRPSLEKALVIAGVSSDEVYELVVTATYNLEEALSSIHHHKEDRQLIEISQRLVKNAEQLKQTLGIGDD